MKELLSRNIGKAHTCLWMGFATLVLVIVLLLLYKYQILHIRETTWVTIALDVACIAALAVLLYRLVELAGFSWDILHSWENSSGLHNWTELMKGKPFLVKARVDLPGRTVLGVSVYTDIATGVRESNNWFVQFDVALPAEVQSGSWAIILDSEEELLHKDAGKVYLLLTSGLTPPRNDSRHPLPGVAPALHQVGGY